MWDVDNCFKFFSVRRERKRGGVEEREEGRVREKVCVWG